MINNIDLNGLSVKNLQHRIDTINFQVDSQEKLYEYFEKFDKTPVARFKNLEQKEYD